MKAYKITFSLEFDHDGEVLTFTDFVKAYSPAAAIKRTFTAYADPDVYIDIISIIEA